MTTTVPTVKTRRLIAGLAASSALLAGLLAPLAPAHAHVAAPHLGGVRDDGSSDFYYDPGSICCVDARPSQKSPASGRRKTILYSKQYEFWVVRCGFDAL